MINSNFIQILLRPAGLRSCIANSKNVKRILDVGCGNKSSVFVKSLSPESHLTGVDVADYNQDEESIALYDEYKIVPANEFDRGISKLDRKFNLILSNHNIEHCEEPAAVFESMVNMLEVGGMLYIATPCLESVGFPSRRGTLNFYDDITHKSPIDLLSFFELSKGKLEIIKYLPNSRPVFWRSLGWINEKRSMLGGKVCLGTWDYWGFEQILWAKKV